MRSGNSKQMKLNTVGACLGDDGQLLSALESIGGAKHLVMREVHAHRPGASRRS
jgi:hypothetical protein